MTAGTHTASTGTSPGRERSAQELRALAEEGAQLLADASAEEIIAWARDTFGERVGTASSMQDTVLPHLVAGVHPGSDVLFLETGYHFQETLTTRDKVAESYPLRVRSLAAAQSVAEQDATYGANLFDTNPDLCCMLRKTTPLFEALDGYEAWMTGLRRAESETRRDAPVVSFDAVHGLVKINPIVAWSETQVEDYAVEHDVIRNPLLDQGYPSIGCAPCTRKVAPGEDPRAGRWAGKAKTECGIHVSSGEETLVRTADEASGRASSVTSATEDTSGEADGVVGEAVVRTDGTGIGRTAQETPDG